MADARNTEPTSGSLVSTAMLTLTRAVALTGLVVSLLCWATAPEGSRCNAWIPILQWTELDLSAGHADIGWGRPFTDILVSMNVLVQKSGPPLTLPGVKFWSMTAGRSLLRVDYWVFAALFLTTVVVFDRRTLTWMETRFDGGTWGLLHRSVLWGFRAALVGALVLWSTSQWITSERMVRYGDREAGAWANARGVIATWGPAETFVGLFNTAFQPARLGLREMAVSELSFEPTWSWGGVSVWSWDRSFGVFEIAHWLICSVLLVLVLALDRKLVTGTRRFVMQMVLRQQQVN